MEARGMPKSHKEKVKNKMDPLDEKIAQLLRKDARQSSEMIAKQLEVSSSNVRRRIRRLIKYNFLYITAFINPKKTGRSLPVVIALDVENNKIETSLESLSQYQEVSWVTTCTGRFDMILLARFASADEVNIFLTKELPKIEGIRNTETFICLMDIGDVWLRRTAEGISHW